jgi:hypothetical protein
MHKPPPVARVVQTQSGLPLEHCTTFPHLDPMHSGLGLIGSHWQVAGLTISPTLGQVTHWRLQSVCSGGQAHILPILSQYREQQFWLVAHLASRGLHFGPLPPPPPPMGAAKLTPGIEASADPATALPNSRNALRRERVPWASSLARSSKCACWFISCTSWTACDEAGKFPPLAAHSQRPRALLVARLDEFPMNLRGGVCLFWSFLRLFARAKSELRISPYRRSSQNAQKANFGELLFHALRCIRARKGKGHHMLHALLIFFARAALKSGMVPKVGTPESCSSFSGECRPLR